MRWLRKYLENYDRTRGNGERKRCPKCGLMFWPAGLPKHVRVCARKVVQRAAC